MKIGLWSDSHNFPSLPLAKLSAWHKAAGDTVEMWTPLEHYDVVYASKVFTDSADLDCDVAVQADKLIKAGTGYEDYTTTLRDEIEHIYPDYGLYPQYEGTAYGFLTRGCPRGCGFCIVGRKEGCCSRRVAELSEFWRGQHDIKLLDPNLLACRDHLTLLEELAASGAAVDFTQGLDIRLINEDNVAALNRVKTKRLHFAWDDPRQDLTDDFKRFRAATTTKDPRRLGVYVLTNYNSTHEQDLYRIYTLRTLGYNPYVMIYDKPHAPQITRRLQRWVNNKIIFWSVDDFENYREGR